MRSVRSRCYFAYDQNTGEIHRQYVIVKPNDILRMTDGGDIPQDILDGIPHDIGAGYVGRTVVLRRITHELPSDASLTDSEGEISLRDRALLENGDKDDILERIEELDEDHSFSRRNSLQNLRAGLSELLGV